MAQCCFANKIALRVRHNSTVEQRNLEYFGTSWIFKNCPDISGRRLAEGHPLTPDRKAERHWLCQQPHVQRLYSEVKKIKRMTFQEMQLLRRRTAAKSAMKRGIESLNRFNLWNCLIQTEITWRRRKNISRKTDEIQDSAWRLHIYGNEWSTHDNFVWFSSFQPPTASNKNSKSLQAATQPSLASPPTSGSLPCPQQASQKDVQTTQRCDILHQCVKEEACPKWNTSKINPSI